MNIHDSSSTIPSTAAIIVAAGRGTRMGASVNKILLDLGGKPVYQHSLDVLVGMSWIRQVVLVVSKEDEALLTVKMRERYPAVQIVLGGERRQDSVWNGLLAVSSACPWVLVQDAARPLIDLGVLQRLASTLLRGNAHGVIPAIPETDTIKEVAIFDPESEAMKIHKTLDRNRLWKSQTPQLFLKASLEKALRQVQTQNIDVTDESQAIEIIGLETFLVRGDPRQRKITTREDLEIIKTYV